MNQKQIDNWEWNEVWYSKVETYTPVSGQQIEGVEPLEEQEIYGPLKTETRRITLKLCYCNSNAYKNKIVPRTYWSIYVYMDNYVWAKLKMHVPRQRYSLDYDNKLKIVC